MKIILLLIPLFILTSCFVDRFQAEDSELLKIEKIKRTFEVYPAKIKASDVIKITAKPKIVKEFYLKNIILNHNGRVYSTYCYEAGNFCSTLKSKKYTFTLGAVPARYREFPFTKLKMPIMRELLKIQDGEKTIFDAEICTVHKVKMQRMTVPIIYGFLDFKGEDKRDYKLFPNWEEYSYAGTCVVSDNSPRIDEKFICTECQRAHNEYLSRASKE